MNQYYIRRYIINSIIIIVFVVIIVKLFFIQVIDSSYKLSASNNVLRSDILYPARGLIFDRDSNLLVFNEAAYDVKVIPNQLNKFDTTDFCNILSISPELLETKLRVAKKYSVFKPSIFLKQVSAITYANLQEKLYKFPGFFVQARTIRKYRKNIAAHILGYVGEVDNRIVKKDVYYQSGDYVGISGIENEYEEELRGEKGVKIFMVDVHNRIQGLYKDGKLNSPSIFGKNVYTTINSDLQEYGEQLMQNKIGSIVAIEPSTGEILALISSPSYNPNLLVGRVRGDNYMKLQTDTLKPLFNRALMAQYPPGSTFKLINGLIGLQENVVNIGTVFSCAYGYTARGVSVGCHNHYSPIKIVGAVQNSCNAYFCNVLKRTLENYSKYSSVENAFIKWEEYVNSFGFGKKLNSDFPNELSGNVPSVDYYNKYYGKKGWGALTVISLAIGQGELGTTPIQMANMAAIIANRGYYYIPHIVNRIEGKIEIDEKFKIKKHTTIDSVNFEIIIEGMNMAVNNPESGGTAGRARMKDVVVCGKTGTAENPFGNDHSIFVAFAPQINPDIAIAVYVENGGFGSTWAAPIAKLMMEKYIKGSITEPWVETYILNANLLDRHAEKGEHIN